MGELSALKKTPAVMKGKLTSEVPALIVRVVVPWLNK
jgi:hypothetical protein